MKRTFHIIFLGLLGLSLFSCQLHAQDAPTIEVLSNNVSGGGFQGDVTITDDGQTIFSAADVSGIFKSTDGGLRFDSRNQGLRSTQVASLAITPDNDQILYAGTGAQGGSGGLFRSTDGGDTWELTAAGENAQFSGNHSANSDPVPDGHPRSNGDLIVVDAGGSRGAFTDDVILAGSYDSGVRIFVSGGDRESAVVEPDGFVRSLAGHADVPNIAYAAIQFQNRSKNGVYRIDYTRRFNPVSTLVYQTPRPEGLTVLSNGNVYAAITTGIARFNGNRWALRNGNTRGNATELDTNNPLRQWTAVTGYLNTRTNRDIVYAGTTNEGGSARGSNYSNIWRTINGGFTWFDIVDNNENVSDQIYGQSHDWWFSTDAFQNAAIGRTNSIVSSIDVALGNDLTNVNDDIVYVSGRGGIWRYETADDLWRPAVNNMQATSNRGVAVNPNNPEQVILANTDYVVLETNSRFEGSDIARDRPNGSESRAHDAIFDARSNELIIGTGDRDGNNQGEVFVKSANRLGDPSGSGWDNKNLLSARGNNADGRVRAVAVGYHNRNNRTNQTILAAVEGEGVFRYLNGSWRQSSGVSIGATLRSNFVWPDNENSGVVYLLDLDAGLFRSLDGGITWNNMFPSLGLNNNDFFSTGYLTADDNDPTTLYLSIQGGIRPNVSAYRVLRLTDADSHTFSGLGDRRITDIGTHSGNTDIRRPGPITFGPDGNLWLTEAQNSFSGNTNTAGLYVMQNPTEDTSFTDVTTNEYRDIAVLPSGIEVAGDGHIYISQGGRGLVRLAVTYSDQELLLGDVNRDGVVNVKDTRPFFDIWRSRRDGAYQLEADLNKDGFISFPDLVAWRVLVTMFSN